MPAYRRHLGKPLRIRSRWPPRRQGTMPNEPYYSKRSMRPDGIASERPKFLESTTKRFAAKYVDTTLLLAGTTDTEATLRKFVLLALLLLPATLLAQNPTPDDQAPD